MTDLIINKGRSVGYSTMFDGDRTGYTGLLHSMGIEVVFTEYIPRPQFERDHFSGGVNLSAQERNAEKRRLHTIDADPAFGRIRKTLIVPNWRRAQFEQQMNEFVDRLDAATVPNHISLSMVPRSRMSPAEAIAVFVRAYHAPRKKPNFTPPHKNR